VAPLRRRALKLVTPMPRLAVTSTTALPEGYAGVGCTVEGECPRPGPGRARVDLQRLGAAQPALRGCK
jgi:hypothetical protein